MNASIKYLALGLLMMVSAAQAQLGPTTQPAPDASQLQPMFNGKDFAGWKEPTPNIWWKFTDGVLIAENDPKLRGNNLYTEKSYKDFEFEMEFRYDGEVDTGVFLRKPLIQVQIGISRSLKKDMTGSVYAEVPPPNNGYKGNAVGTDKVLKTGDWNKMHFVAKGDVLKVWLNDTQVLETSIKDYPDAAPIGLQIHGGVKMKVEFRNVKMRDLSAAAQ